MTYMILECGSVCRVGLQESTPPKIRQLIFTITNIKNQLTDCAGINVCKTTSKTLRARQRAHSQHCFGCIDPEMAQYLKSA